MIRKRAVLVQKALVLTLFFNLSACQKSQLLSESRFMLNTVCVLTVYEGGSRQALSQAFAAIAEVESLLSFYKEDSDVARVNAAAGREAVAVSQAAYDVIAAALTAAKLSGGLFDPTVGPLSSAWSVNQNPRVPPPQEIASLLPLVDYRNVILNQEERSVFLAKPGMSLDLGGIAKGYAADKAVFALKAAGAVKAIVNLGGNIAVIGSKGNGEPWNIGVQAPFAPRNAYAGIIKAADEAVVSSGPYERNFEQDGVFYHHILDPRTGYPAQSDLLGATAAAASSITADALATTCFILGRQQALSFMQSLPEEFAGEALLIGRDNSISATPKLQKNFVLADSAYHTDY